MKSGRLALVGVAILALAAVLVSGALTRPASADSGQGSVNVAVIPGFHAPHYSDTHGIPPFPAGDSQLSGYHYGEIGASAVTSDALKGFDTVVLYGLKWSDLSSDEQAAVNAFARTGKVVIWDADSTPSQDYASFVKPFSTTASGEAGGSHGAVVTFPGGADPIASPDSSSALYLDPHALVASTHLIGHMSVMNSGASGWAPGLIAANSRISTGGWVLAWGYGSTTDHTGMVIYSGMDADAFTDATTPNYAIKELALDLAAPFQRSADTCAPNCAPPPVPTPGGGSSGGGSGGGGDSTPSGLGAPSTQTFAQCSLARPAPRAWVRGNVSLSLATSVAEGIHGSVVTAAGKIVGSGATTTPGHVRLTVNTRLLPSNRRSLLTAVIYVNAVKACTVGTGLSVDNRDAHVRIVKVQVTKHAKLVTLRTSETVRLTITNRSHTLRRVAVLRGKAVTVALPLTLTKGTFVAIDRAGNRSSQTITLH